MKTIVCFVFTIFLTVSVNSPLFAYEESDLFKLLETRDCFLLKADLKDSNLEEANLEGARLGNIDPEKLKGTKLKDAIWINGKKCKSESIGQCLQ